VNITAFKLAERFTGLQEMSGSLDNPQIMAMLKLDNRWPENDEVPWCSAFVNYICWLLRLPRSKDLRARSWLQVGKPITLDHACAGFDIVVLSRGPHPQPGSEVINAPGHVGFFAGVERDYVQVLGGNQSNTVKVSSYKTEDLLSVRSLV
jgi:uncharacterized protein (TIGR02594 family)